MSRRRTVLASVLALAGALSLGAGVAFANDEPDSGVGLQVRVTASPSPSVVAPPAIPSGESVASARFPIMLSGLDPHSYVEVFANSTPVLIASGFADANGNFETTVSLPPNLAPGEHSITATNVTASGSKKTITIVKFAVTASGKIAPAGASSTSQSSASRATGGAATASRDGTVSSETVPAADAEAALGADPFSVGGALWFGGYRASASYREGIFDPDISTELVIRNVTDSSVTAIGSLSIASALGVQVSARDDIELATLAPGETRRVHVLCPNVGSWAFYDVAMEIRVADSEESVTRHASAFVFPLASLLVAFVVLLTVTVAVWVFSKSGLRLKRRRVSGPDWLGVDEATA